MSPLYYILLLMATDKIFGFGSRTVAERLDKFARNLKGGAESIMYPKPRGVSGMGTMKLGRPKDGDHTTNTWVEYFEYELVTGSNSPASKVTPDSILKVWQESGFTYRQSNTHFLWSPRTDRENPARKFIALPVPLKECEADLPDPGGNNFILTSDGAGGAIAEANATFDGNNLTIDNNIQSSTGFILRSNAKDITASTTQTQAGATVLNREVNHVSTVANANDTVRLPVAQDAKHCRIYNRGANTLQIFPASGDSIDGGTVDASVTLASNKTADFDAFDAIDWKMVLLN